MERLWALSLISRFLKESGLENTLETLKLEATDAFEDLDKTIVPLDKPLVAILEEYQLSSGKSKQSAVSPNMCF